MPWNTLQSIFFIAGGLVLFLYGIKIMSDGLKLIAGDKMKSFLEKSTSNRFLALITGFLVTGVIQSSTAATVMVVGFVNAGLLNLKQAIGVIMGANVGTTLTAQIISFKIDNFIPIIMFVGLILFVFFKKQNTKNIGMILLGFGMLFFGLSAMSGTLSTFAENTRFQTILTTFQNPFLAILAGFIFTAITQSSTATIGIIVALFVGGIDLNFHTAIYLVLGSYVGTCLTAMIAAIPANKESKRAALAHVMFNVVGCIVFGTAIVIFPEILIWLQNTWTDGARQIAMFHTLFNIATVSLLLPFIKQLEFILKKIISD